jgi:hypothetical protein
MSKLHQETYKSDHHDWKTNPRLIALVLTALGKSHFSMDVCCADDHVPAHERCMKSGTYGYGDQKISSLDGLENEWWGICWMNPPYGRDLQKFVRRAHAEAQTEDCEVIGILPVRTETKYFHECVFAAEAMFFFQGKISFWNDHYEHRPIPESQFRAPFPVMLAFWGMDRKKIEVIVETLQNNEYPGTVIWREGHV